MAKYKIRVKILISILAAITWIGEHSLYCWAQDTIEDTADTNTVDDAADPNVDSLEKMAEAQEAAARQQANILSQDATNQMVSGKKAGQEKANERFLRKLTDSEIPSSMTQEELEQLAKTQARVTNEFERISTTAITNVP